ncbi:hypothetical protein EV421DRAFT_1909375 [Armillaria borealis]|uniref:F-box domain-containing protein n=1 Tax=Armillaria borealis TaxID=47425 RepID=A0AA39MHX6_9AGAR|nr:hypothetical protein EV421DRAFT_1909375 [Armillaria borealis]
MDAEFEGTVPPEKIQTATCTAAHLLRSARNAAEVYLLQVIPVSSSELFHKLRDGRSPLDSEICSISSVRSQVAKEIDAYNTEILQLWQTLLKLQRDRDRLKVYAEHFDALLSPIRRLPYDILLQIFERVCTETFYIRPPVITLRLGLVCKRWRDVTLDTLSLWSNIFIPSPNIPGYRWTYVYKTVQLQLLRSRQMPLALNVESFQAGKTRAFSLIMDQLHRVRRVECSAKTLSLLPSSLLDATEQLTITEGSARVGTLDLPKPQSLAILDFNSLAGAILPQHIHTLNLVFRSGAFDAVIYNLSTMRSLCYLTLESRSFQGDANTNHLPVHLTRLTSLTCHHLRHNDDISRLLASVYVLSLTHLTIIGGSLQLDFLKSLLERSNSPLQKLEILINVVSFAAVDLPTLIGILRIVPGLTTMVIHEQKEKVLLLETLFIWRSVGTMILFCRSLSISSSLQVHPG